MTDQSTIRNMSQGGPFPDEPHCQFVRDKVCSLIITGTCLPQRDRPARHPAHRVSGKIGGIVTS
jgi:hypothetical protein